MPDSADLLEAAKLLLSTDPPPPTDARLRRAVSSAYYAVFHHLSAAGAARFAGPAPSVTGAYLLMYRSFEHGIMRQAFTVLRQAKLSPRAARVLNRLTVSPNVIELAGHFEVLIEQRIIADYDPLVSFGARDAQGLVKIAELAIAAFDRTAPDEQADVLAFLMVKPRP